MENSNVNMPTGSNRGNAPRGSSVRPVLTEELCQPMVEEFESLFIQANHIYHDITGFFQRWQHSDIACRNLVTISQFIDNKDVLGHTASDIYSSLRSFIQRDIMRDCFIYINTDGYTKMDRLYVANSKFTLRYNLGHLLFEEIKKLADFTFQPNAL